MICFLLFLKVVLVPGLLANEVGKFLSSVASSKKKKDAKEKSPNPVAESVLLFMVAFFFLCMMGAAYAEAEGWHWWDGFWSVVMLQHSTAAN